MGHTSSSVVTPIPYAAKDFLLPSFGRQGPTLLSNPNLAKFPALSTGFSNRFDHISIVKLRRREIG
jgi:hypothetical protein